jgi:hypothetical protein
VLCIEDWRYGFQDSGTELYIFIVLLGGFHFWNLTRSRNYRADEKNLKKN